MAPGSDNHSKHSNDPMTPTRTTPTPTTISPASPASPISVPHPAPVLALPPISVPTFIDLVARTSPHSSHHPEGVFDTNKHANVVIASRSRVHAYVTTVNSVILTADDKDQFVNCYLAAFRAHSALKKLVAMYRLRHTKRANTTKDLCLDDMANHPAKHRICLVEDNCVYEFYAGDLFSIITKKLSSHDDYFTTARPISNPYTGIEFSIHNLYNIYLFLRGTSWGVPKLYEMYFRTNFNLLEFTEFYASDLRDAMIVDDARVMSDEDLRENVKRMILAHKSVVGCQCVSPEYPIDVLRKSMNGYMELYLRSVYSTCRFRRRRCESVLRTKLKVFFRENPRFGRQILRATPVYKEGSHFEKTGGRRIDTTFITDITPVAYYPGEAFNSSPRILELMTAQTAVATNDFTSSLRVKRVLTMIDDSPINGFSLADDDEDDDNDDDGGMYMYASDSDSDDEDSETDDDTVVISDAIVPADDSDDSDDDDDIVAMECEIFIDRVGRDPDSEPEPGPTLSYSHYPENRSRIAVTSRWMEEGEIDEESGDVGVLVNIRVDQSVMSRVDGITGRTVSDLRNILGDVVMERIMGEIRDRIADMDNTVRGTMIIVVKEGPGVWVSGNDVDIWTDGRHRRHHRPLISRSRQYQPEEPVDTLVDVVYPATIVRSVNEVDEAVDVDEEEEEVVDWDEDYMHGVD